MTWRRRERETEIERDPTAITDETGQLDLPDGLVFVDGRVDGAANLDRVEVDVAARALLRNFVLNRDKQR